MIRHNEIHKTHRIGWLRAAVLGANDGLISTSSLVLGVVASGATPNSILIAGVAGLVAGSMSMAAGEYVSVSSQSDTEKADLDIERKELASDPVGEHKELVQIYTKRGLDEVLANQVATQLMNYDALGTHTREELGITEFSKAKPLQAAFTSALTFIIGAIMPLLIILTLPSSSYFWAVSLGSLFFLGFLGAFGAIAGGASILKGAVRVIFWGALAMAVTSGIGAVFGQI